MKHATSGLARAFATLDQHQDAILTEGERGIETPSGLALKSFQVYFARWWRARGHDKSGLAATTSVDRMRAVRALYVKTSIAPPSAKTTGRIIAVTDIQSAAQSMAKFQNADLLEQWAIACLTSGVPLEDVLAAGKGQPPAFSPQTPEGQRLLGRIGERK